ncbi:hypothetical protein Q0590_26600 [Rhodocytophaga aerolata]|uniref:Uncharacterized protein n=1 Tax=Rhodocytophaga aerolata TaxID=455078 RepID=A0ABT8RFD4_9BACT|nr:hypothetical protein [Rhodocytophaga aerolata]MDO1449878.1 hypothetical protein [Rhodocytophaga aerolata]
MSEFRIRYRELPEDELYADETITEPRINARANKLLLETSIAAICMISFAGNIISYTRIQDLEQLQDKHLLRYDSLLSAKLLSDQELARLKASSHTYPAEDKLIRILTHEAALPEENPAPDGK